MDIGFYQGGTISSGKGGYYLSRTPPYIHGQCQGDWDSEICHCDEYRPLNLGIILSIQWGDGDDIINDRDLKMVVELQERYQISAADTISDTIADFKQKKTS